jgi:hypothetical protein
LIAAIVVALILASASLFDNERQMRPHFTAPYLSGAANFEIGKPWVWSPSEGAEFGEMSIQERERHRFERRDDLVRPTRLEVGYMYIVLVARSVFFWMGDIQAVEALQLVVHILITLAGMALLRSWLARLLLLLLYGLNPVVLHIVTYPFYYFWQTIPAALIFFYLIRKDLRLGWGLLPVGFLLGLSFITRPTVVLTIGLLGLLMLIRERPRTAIAGILVMIATVIVLNQDTIRSNPWHTMYVSVGAYPNPYGIEFADWSGFQYYEEQTGIEIDPRTGGNYEDPELREDYRQRLKARYKEIFVDSPLMLVRNAALNIFQSFGPGYVTASRGLSYASAFLGLLVLLLLLVRRKFLWVVAIGLCSITFTPYCPPIPVYMFGAYILIVGGIIAVLSETNVFAAVEHRLAGRILPPGRAAGL